MILGGVGLFGYTQITQEKEQAKQINERSFKKLNITVDDFDEKQISKLTAILQDYTADYCDPRSKIALIKRIAGAGFVRLAAQLASEHYQKCAKDPQFLLEAYSYNKQLGEYEKALVVMNQLIEFDPANATFRFDRGNIYEDTNRFEKALVDYISTLDLLGRPEEIHPTQFYYIATMYAKLGRFCEAATPLETYVSYDPVKRKDPQIDRLISEYRSKGNCKVSTSSDSTSVPVKKSGSVLIVEATLNNAKGLFILDTGASLVSVTKSFADRAKISIDTEDRVTLQTANGISEGFLSTAGSIRVGNAYSTLVPVVVVDDAKLKADDNIIGLLGMSFLSRFALSLGKDLIELRSRF